MSTTKHIISEAQSISQNVLKHWAADVDAKNRFPQESMDALREVGLLRFFVPGKYAGLGGDFKTYCRIATILGEECLSTALIWAMHCQQVIVLADHAAEEQADVLSAIVQNGSLVASVTSESGKGGDLLTAQSPLRPEPNRNCIRVCRKAPIVSYGAEADFYLITMRAAEDRPTNDVSLVVVTPDSGQIVVAGEWNAMGMKGTRSVPMEFDVVVNCNRVISKSFRQIALQTMIPAGHLGWAAAWFGAARGAFKFFVNMVRTMKGKGKWKPNSDLFISRLANLRISLDLIEAMLNQVVQRFEKLRNDRMPLEHYEDITYNIALNNLKVAGSRLVFSIADELIELGGLGWGYLKNETSPFERVFRDLRSASLMYSNDRLLEANGRLILVEHSPISAIWQQSKSGGKSNDETANRLKLL